MTARRKPYSKPLLVVYGRLEELTLTQAPPGPRNDGGSPPNFKT